MVVKPLVVGGTGWKSRHNPGLSGGRFLLYRLEKEA